jgi:ribosomal protein L10
MLDRSIPTREALFQSILISEVKNIESDVLRALRASPSEKRLKTLFVGSILTIFKKEKLHAL